MSVTDGLKEWVGQHMPNAQTMSKSLLKVADKIDAKIERCYIPLPLDADGEIIRPGDTLYYKRWSGEVETLCIDGDGWYIDIHGFPDIDIDDKDVRYYPHLFSHRDTYEMTARDIIEKYVDKLDDCYRWKRGNSEEIVDEFTEALETFMA